MKRFAITTLAALGILLGAVPVACADDTLTPGKFKFVTFSVPGSITLAVNQINDLGVIVGDYSIATEAVKGFVRSANGQLTTLVYPQTPPDFTAAYGNNDEGTVVGYFFNNTDLAYEGYFYRHGMFTNFIYPGLPAHSATIISGINNTGDFCGFYQNSATSFVPATGYLSDNGHITAFLVQGSTNTYCDAVNDFDFVAGTYIDPAGKSHGFLRDPKGNISTVDVPGASETFDLNVNDVGWVSGNFTDSSGKSHGFIGVPDHQSWHFFQIDVPTAAKTSGGGLNNFATVVGHWNTSAGQEMGYIAYPQSQEDE